MDPSPEGGRHIILLGRAADIDMTCDSVRQTLLDLALDADVRRRLSRALAHAEACDACRGTLRDIDGIVRALERPPEQDRGDERGQSTVMPRGGWGAFERRMLSCVSGAASAPTDGERI